MCTTRFVLVQSYFNTSYVTVQLIFGLKEKFLIMYFNTSYVTVQLLFLFFAFTVIFHFNTSYVTVQLVINPTSMLIKLISIHPMLRFNAKTWGKSRAYYKISIHPMLRFNFIKKITRNYSNYFNTSYVTVQL